MIYIYRPTRRRNEISIDYILFENINGKPDTTMSNKCKLLYLFYKT